MTGHLWQMRNAGPIGSPLEGKKLTSVPRHAASVHQGERLIADTFTILANRNDFEIKDLNQVSTIADAVFLDYCIIHLDKFANISPCSGRNSTEVSVIFKQHPVGQTFLFHRAVLANLLHLFGYLVRLRAWVEQVSIHATASRSPQPRGAGLAPLSSF